MTRVEKYREYRKEILNSFYTTKEESKKSMATRKVSEATLNKDTANSMSVEQVLEAYQVYDEEKPVAKKKQLNTTKKKEILFFLIGIGIVAILITALIIVGVNAFGGK